MLLSLISRYLLAIVLVHSAALNAQTSTPTTGAPVGNSARANATTGLAAELAPNAPARYTIKSGDTLWALSSLYLKSPWRWPDLWRMNRADIRNPHLIYPGQILVLSFDANGQPMLNFAGSAAADGTTTERPTVRISPQLRFENIARDNAIPSIPPSELEPFLTRPLVIDANALDTAPEIILTDDKRVVLARGDIAYALGLNEKMGRDWQVYRPSGELRDPRHPFKQWFQRTDWFGGKKEPDIGLLGYEAMYLGDARVVQFGDVTKIEVVNSREEIAQKDRLIMTPTPERISYVPRAPDKAVDSVVIKLHGPLAEAGRGAVIAIASGAKDGLEVGHVVSFARPPRQVPNARYVRPGVFSTLGMTDPNPSKEPQFFTLPEERIGLGFVFRTFERVSYVYIVSSSAMVRIGDFVRKP